MYNMESNNSARQAAFEKLRDATDQAAEALSQFLVEQPKLRLRITELEANNAKLTDELGDAQTEVKMLTQDQELLRKELELEKRSNNRLQEELDMPLRLSTSTDEELDLAKIEIENLNSEVSELRDELSHLTMVEEQLDENRAIVRQLDEEIDDLKAERLRDSKLATEQVQRHQTTVHDLKQRIADLEYERKQKEPLVRKAVAIRRNFLAQAREKLGLGQIDVFVAEYETGGNAVVHGGDGLADEALLLGGYLDSEEWGEVFEALYGKKAGEFGACPKGLRRVHDCEVTIKVVQAVRGARPSFTERSEAEAQIRAIKKMYEENSEGAERDAIVQNGIARVEALTEEIVQAARGGDAIIKETSSAMMYEE